jgi:hypothetical protein
MDAYIRRSLKNWASEQQPQSNKRAHLLLAASVQRELPAVNEPKDRASDVIFSRPSPIDQASKIYNLPWLWAAHVSLTPIRSVT